MSEKEEQIPLFPDLSRVPPQLREGSRKLIERSGKGIGIGHKQAPVSVMLPPELDAKVREMPNRSEFIREAIAEKLGKKGKEGSGSDKDAIAQFLMTLPPPKRKEARKVLDGFLKLKEGKN